MIGTVSTAGEVFIIDKESCPTRAYKDIGGVVTIGPGLTMLSRTFAEYWKTTRGHALRLGDEMPRAEALKVFRSVLAEEYVPPVRANIAPKEQHHLDGGASVSWNAGTGSTKWKWAQALRAGNAKQAAALLLTTAITAGGRPIQGLKNRRKAEARLIEFGDYGHSSTTEGGASGISSTPEEIKEYQTDLKTLGFYRGQVNGVHVKGDMTDGAVRNFQAAEHLKVDGRVGPATRSAIARALTRAGQGKGALGGLGGAGLTGFTFQIDNPFTLVLIAVAILAALGVAFWIWNNRGVILRTRIPA